MAELAAAGDELPRDNPSGAQTNRHVAHASSRLDTALTRKLLQVAPAAYRTQVNDLLLAALARVLCDWTEDESILIQLEGHGREDLFPELDLSRTLGWFSSLFPVRLTPARALGAGLCAIKEQLRAVPKRYRQPTLYNMGGSGKTPFLTAAEIEELGFKVVIYPNFIMRAQIQAAQGVLRELKSTGSLENTFKNMSGWEERHELLRMGEVRELEKRYGVDEKSRVGLES